MIRETILGLLIALSFLSSLAFQDQQDIEVAEALAADYAEMLEREAACETWQCIQNIGAE